MSISPAVESSGTTSIITSQGESVTDADIGKNTEAVSIKGASQVCNRGGCGKTKQ